MRASKAVRQVLGLMAAILRMVRLELWTPIKGPETGDIADPYAATAREWAPRCAGAIRPPVARAITGTARAT